MKRKRRKLEARGRKKPYVQLLARDIFNIYSINNCKFNSQAIEYQH
jgi:hypothetical protein